MATWSPYPPNNNPQEPPDSRGASGASGWPRMPAKPCSRCWKPLTHCACPPSEVIRDPGQMAALERLRVMADAGCWSDDADTANLEQRRWAFLVWRLDRGQIEAG